MRAGRSPTRTPTMAPFSERATPAPAKNYRLGNRVPPRARTTSAASVNRRAVQPQPRTGHDQYLVVQVSGPEPVVTV